MVNKINEKLNEVFNNLSGCDAPMWCELINEDRCYLTWHICQDNYINASLFKSCAIIIFTEFKEINEVTCPFYSFTRNKLMQIIKKARKDALKRAC